MKQMRKPLVLLALLAAAALLLPVHAVKAEEHRFGPWSPVPGENLHMHRCETCDLLETEPHRAGAPQISNVVPATCTQAGSHDETYTCAACGFGMGESHVTDPPLGHSPGDPVEENRVEPRPGIPGSYDKVVYCTACHAELSREKITIDPLPTDPPVPTDPPEPTDPPKPTDPPEPTPVPPDPTDPPAPTPVPPDPTQKPVHTADPHPAEMVIADETEQTEATQKLAEQIRAAQEAGDLLSVVPEETREKIPEAMKEMPELLTMRLVNWEGRKGTVFVRVCGEGKYPADEPVHVVIAIPGDPETKWISAEGISHEDGMIRLTLEAETLAEIGDRVFVMMILTK